MLTESQGKFGHVTPSSSHVQVTQVHMLTESQVQLGHVHVLTDMQTQSSTCPRGVNLERHAFYPKHAVSTCCVGQFLC